MHDLVARRQALLGPNVSTFYDSPAQLDLFLALRAATYVGWIVPRMKEPGSPMRNIRFIEDAQDLCGAWLAQVKLAQAQGG